MKPLPAHWQPFLARVFSEGHYGVPKDKATSTIPNGAHLTPLLQFSALSEDEGVDLMISSQGLVGVPLSSLDALMAHASYFHPSTPVVNVWGCEGALIEGFSKTVESYTSPWDHRYQRMCATIEPWSQPVAAQEYPALVTSESFYDAMNRLSSFPAMNDTIVLSDPSLATTAQARSDLIYGLMGYSDLTEVFEWTLLQQLEGHLWLFPLSYSSLTRAVKPRGDKDEVQATLTKLKASVDRYERDVFIAQDASINAIRAEYADWKASL